MSHVSSETAVCGVCGVDTPHEDALHSWRVASRAERAEARADRLTALLVEATGQDFGTPGWRDRVRKELFG